MQIAESRDVTLVYSIYFHDTTLNLHHRQSLERHTNLELASVHWLPQTVPHMEREYTFQLSPPVPYCNQSVSYIQSCKMWKMFSIVATLCSLMFVIPMVWWWLHRQIILCNIILISRAVDWGYPNDTIALTIEGWHWTWRTHTDK